MALEILTSEEEKKKREEEQKASEMAPAPAPSQDTPPPEKQVSFERKVPMAWLAEQVRAVIQEEVARGHKNSSEGFLTADELTGLATATAESGWAKITRPDGTSEFRVVDAQGESYTIDQIKSSLSKQKAAFESVGEPGAGVAFLDQLSKTFSTALAPNSPVLSEPTPDMVMNNFFKAMQKEKLLSDGDLEEMKKLDTNDEDAIAVVDVGGLSMETYLPVIEAAVQARADGSPKMVAMIAGLTHLAEDKQFKNANPLQKKLIAYSVIDQTSRLIADKDVQMVSKGMDKLRAAETGILDRVQFELETARPDIELKDFEFQYSDEEVEAANNRIKEKDTKARELQADYLKLEEELAVSKPRLQELNTRKQESLRLIEEAQTKIQMSGARDPSEGVFGSRRLPKLSEKEIKALQEQVRSERAKVTGYQADMDEITARLKPTIERRNLLVKDINETLGSTQADVQIATGKGIMPRGKLRQIVGQYSDTQLEQILRSPADYVKVMNDNAFTFNGESKDYVNASAAYFVNKVVSKWVKDSPKSRAITEQLERDVFTSIQNGTLKQDFPGIYQGAVMLSDKYEQYKARASSDELNKAKEGRQEQFDKLLVSEVYKTWYDEENGGREKARAILEEQKDFASPEVYADLAPKLADPPMSFDDIFNNPKASKAAKAQAMLDLRVESEDVADVVAAAMGLRTQLRGNWDKGRYARFEKADDAITKVVNSGLKNSQKAALISLIADANKVNPRRVASLGSDRYAFERLYEVFSETTGRAKSFDHWARFMNEYEDLNKKLQTEGKDLTAESRKTMIERWVRNVEAKELTNTLALRTLKGATGQQQ